MTDEYTAEMAHAAVERGANWLDEKCPEWAKEIDVARLDLGRPSMCVLGQTAGCLTGAANLGRPYALVLNHFGKGTEWATEFGFEVPMHQWVAGICIPEKCNKEIDARYEMLTIAWREYIRQRLEAAS